MGSPDVQRMGWFIGLKWIRDDAAKDGLEEGQDVMYPV